MFYNQCGNPIKHHLGNKNWSWGCYVGFITKGQRKIRPNGIKPNFQKAQLNFRPKIKKGDF